MNAIDLLRSDHRRISELLNSTVDSAETETAHDLRELTHELHFHNAMLRRCLYPELQHFDEISSSVNADERNALQIDQLLADLEANQTGEERRAGTLKRLFASWEAHVDRSERKLLPEAEKLLGAAKLQQLFYDMDAIRAHQSDQDSAIYPASRLGPKA